LEFIEVAGYLASLLIGVTMGLMGGGGSILTIPVLVYLFSFSPTIAISHSLFIVGFTSLVGAFNSYRNGLVSIRTVILFGSASITTVFAARKFLIPLLPDVFFEIGSFQVTHAFFVMVVFALLMLAASLSMIRSRTAEVMETRGKPGWLITYGMLIGLVTGLLGAGGGFLLVPALVMIMKLSMKKAIGTSLVIIALNSLIGFLGDLGRHAIDWKFLGIVTAIAIGGIFIGGYLNSKVDSEKLKKGFGWFVLLLGILIIIKEIL
jgi:uncharacterized membrane protein YfcA